MPTGNTSWPAALDALSVASPQDNDTFATGLETLGQYLRDLRAFQNAVETDLGVATSPPTGTLRAQVGSNATSLATVQANPMFSVLSQTPVLTYTPFPDRLVVQRMTTTGGVYNLGVGTLSLKLTCQTLIGLIEYRLRDAVTTGNPVVKPYAVVGGFVRAGTGGNITLSVVDFPAGLGWFFLDVRINGSDAQTYLGTNRIGCGEVIGIAGSDLAVDFLSNLIGSDTSTSVASAGVSPSPNASVFATTGLAYPIDNVTPAVWGLSGDGTPYKSTQVCEFLRLVSLSSGCNAALVGHAISNTNLSEWLPGQPLYATLKTVLTQAGGVFGGFLWIQGTEDAAASTTQAAYLAGLQSFFSDLATSYPGLPFCRLLSSIPAFGGANLGSVDAISTVRSAALAYLSGDALSAHIDGLDTTLSTDLFHPVQAGGVLFAHHAYRAWRRLRLGTSGNLGPRMTTATHSANSANVLVNFAHSLGTDLALSGFAVNQFAVFASGDTTTPLALTSLIRMSATQLQLTLASAPDNAVSLDVRYRDGFLDTPTIIANAVTDNWAGFGGDGLTNPTAVRLSAAPVTAPAPGGGTGPGGALPSITPTLVAHYDASASNVLFSDSALTTAQSTGGGTVAGWKDSSSTAAHLLNTLGGSSVPTLALNSQNGLPGIRFLAGTSKQFVRLKQSGTFFPLMTSSITLLLVFKAASTPNFYVPSSLYNSNASSGNLDLFALQMISATGVLKAIRSGLTAPTTPTSPSYPATGTLMKVVIRFDLPNNTIYTAMNGVTESSITTVGPYIGVGMANWDTFSLGEAVNRFYTFDGTIYEAALFNGVATTSDRDALLAFATSKWGF